MEMPAAPEGEQPLCHGAALRPRSTGAKLCSCVPAEKAEPLPPGSEERGLGSHPGAGSAAVRAFFRHLRWVLTVLGCPQRVRIPGSPGSLLAASRQRALPSLTLTLQLGRARCSLLKPQTLRQGCCQPPSGARGWKHVSPGPSRPEGSERPPPRIPSVRARLPGAGAGCRRRSGGGGARPGPPPGSAPGPPHTAPGGAAAAAGTGTGTARSTGSTGSAMASAESAEQRALQYEQTLVSAVGTGHGGGQRALRHVAGRGAVLG